MLRTHGWERERERERGKGGFFFVPLSRKERNGTAGRDHGLSSGGLFIDIGFGWEGEGREEGGEGGEGGLLSRRRGEEGSGGERRGEMVAVLVEWRL